jgi:hypothetical protein
MRSRGSPTTPHSVSHWPVLVYYFNPSLSGNQLSAGPGLWKWRECTCHMAMNAVR